MKRSLQLATWIDWLENHQLMILLLRNRDFSGDPVIVHRAIATVRDQDHDFGSVEIRSDLSLEQFC